MSCPTLQAMTLRYRVARIIRNLASWIDPRTRGMGWVCFHCGEHFANPNLAGAHFGAAPNSWGASCATPACILVQERGMLYELREAQKQASEAVARERRAEDEADMLRAEMGEYERATGAHSCHELRMWKDSMEGRVVTADALIEAVREKAPDLYAAVIG